jgi:hypothetical protein
MAGDEEEQGPPDPFDGNDPFLTHAAGIDRAVPTLRKRTQPEVTTWADIFTTVGLIIFPWLLFVGLSCLFTFAYHYFYDTVWIVVIFCIILSFVPIALGRSRKTIAFLFLGVLCCVATIAASAFGLYNYHENMFAYWSYLNNGVYTNLLPSEPAESHTDAGKIFFSDDARVDTTKAVGYKDGTVYCAAPILDDVPIAKVQYWAVGMDCCSQRADFNCDDSWSPKAHSGVVILESNDWLPSHRDAYMKAVDLAQSTYGIISQQDPIFVRWVAEPEVVQDDYWRSGVGFLVAEVCIYLLVSIIFGIIAQQSIKRTRAGYLL